MLDTDGNSKWQVSTPNGDNEHSNMIKYFPIDASTDMIVATSGLKSINYNKIISTSSPPYSIISN
jgi:hypothetical protein